MIFPALGMEEDLAGGRDVDAEAIESRDEEKRGEDRELDRFLDVEGDEEGARSRRLG